MAFPFRLPRFHYFLNFFLHHNKKFTSLLVCWVRMKCLNIPGMVRIGLEFERGVGRSTRIRMFDKLWRNINSETRNFLN